MNLELTWVPSELLVIEENHISSLEVLCFDMSIMPCLLAILFNLLVKYDDGSIFLKLYQLRQVFFKRSFITHACRCCNA